jgi:hypothetical protein
LKLQVFRPNCECEPSYCKSLLLLTFAWTHLFLDGLY